MPLLLERKGLRVGGAVNGDLAGVHFGSLPLGRRRLDFALNAEAGPGGEVLDGAVVVVELAVGDDLRVAETGAVVDFEEAEAAFGVTARAQPALQQNALADGVGPAGGGDGDFVHDLFLTRPAESVS